MSSKYDYLQRYIGNIPIGKNWFQKFSKVEIEESEQRLGYNFPKQLKEFWLEIGYGFIKESYITTDKRTSTLVNRIIPPEDIADLILLKEESGLILPDVPMIEGAIPFFEIGDLQDFLAMLPKSDKPEAIYDQVGNYVEKDLETFIHRLYYESPTYYLNVNNKEE